MLQRKGSFSEINDSLNRPGYQLGRELGKKSQAAVSQQERFGQILANVITNKTQAITNAHQ